MEQSQSPRHAAFSTFSQLVAVKNWPEIAELTKSPETSLIWRKVLSYLALVEDLFESTPAEQTSVAGLNALNTVFQNAFNSLVAFRDNKNAAYLTQAMEHIDQSGYSQLWAFAPSKGSRALPKKMLDELATHASQLVKGLATANADSQKQIDNLDTELAELRKEITAAKKRVDVEQVRVSAVADEGRVSFATAINESKQQAGTQLTDQQSSFAKFSEASSQSIDQMKAAAQDKTSTILEELNRKLAEARTLVGLVGDTAITGNYQITATKETKEANLWRWITLVVFVLAGVVGALALVELANKTITWEVALVRVLFGGLVASVAFYTGSESARHRTNGDRAKRVELELASLGPFLEDLPKEKREEIRQALAAKYFANDGAAHEVGGVVSAKDALALAEKSIDALQKIGKK
jgi:hypothetical protein